MYNSQNNFSFAPGTDLTAPGVLGTTPFGNQFGNQMAGNVLGGADKLMSVVNFGANIAALNPAFLPLAMATNMTKFTTGQFMQGAQQQIAVDNMLNRTFKNRDMGGNYGMGVSREGAKQFTDAMRNMSNTAELMTNDRELLNTFQKLNDMKFFQSTKNIKEMTGKFEKAVKTMRQMSMDLNKSMEDMAPIMQQAVQSGFFNFEDIRRNAALNKYTQGVGVGFSDGRIEGLQQFGSSTFHAMGGKRQLGAEAIRTLSGKLSVGLQRGVINEQTLNEYTGKMGEDAIADVSQQLLSANARILQQSEQGKLISAYLAEQDESGKFTGKIDKSKLANLGKVGLNDITTEANKKIGKNAESAISFENEMKKGMGANLSSQLGANGIENIIQSITKDSGLGREAKRKLISDIGQLDMRLTDILLESSKELATIGGEYDRQLKQNERRSRLASQIEYNSLSARFGRFKTRMSDNLMRPLQETGAEAVVSVGNKFDRIGKAISRASFNKFIDEINPLASTFLDSTQAYRDDSIGSQVAKDIAAGTSGSYEGLTNSGVGSKYQRLVNMRTEQLKEDQFSGIAGLRYMVGQLPGELVHGSSEVHDYTFERDSSKKAQRIQHILTSGVDKLKQEVKGKDKEMQSLLESFNQILAENDGADPKDVLDKFIPLARSAGIDVGVFLRLAAESPEYNKLLYGQIGRNAQKLLDRQMGIADADVFDRLTVKDVAKIQENMADIASSKLDQFYFGKGSDALQSVFEKEGGSISFRETVLKIIQKMRSDSNFELAVRSAQSKTDLCAIAKEAGIDINPEEMTDDIFAGLKELAVSGNLEQAGEAADAIQQELNKLKAISLNTSRIKLSSEDTRKLEESNSPLAALVKQYNEASGAGKRNILQSNYKDFLNADLSGLSPESELVKMTDRLKQKANDFKGALGEGTDEEKKKKALDYIEKKGIGSRKDYESRSLQDIEKLVMTNAFSNEVMSNSVTAQDQAALDDVTQGYAGELSENMAKINQQSIEFAEAVSKVIDSQKSFNDSVTQGLKSK